MTPAATNVVTSENFGMQHTGDGTFYTFADGTGACLYDKTTDIHIAALNVSDWANSAWCGACADVTGPDNKMVRVRIVDECGDCAPGQLDMHPMHLRSWHRPPQVVSRSAGRSWLAMPSVP